MFDRSIRAAAALAGLAVAALLAAPAAMAADVTVFAAASLKNALDDVAAAWKAEAGKQATISYAASSALAKQIEEGAPADVFISADLDWMDYLAERDLIRDGHGVELLGNRLVLIAPADSDAALEIDAGLRPRRRARRRPARDGRGRLGAGRQVRQGGARRARRLGRGRRPASPRPRTCAPRWRSSRPARRRSASSTRPTPTPSRRSGSSAPSPRTATRRSSIRRR